MTIEELFRTVEGVAEGARRMGRKAIRVIVTDAEGHTTSKTLSLTSRPEQLAKVYMRIAEAPQPVDLKILPVVR